ncbi:MAG: serine protease [Proteobacteria bacterium]|nr:MAG: serine protease [Pseudomonadota bacterium]
MVKKTVQLWSVILFLLQSAQLMAGSLDTLPDTIDAIKPSIVGIGSYNRLSTPQSALKGTGFVVDGGQYVVTNFHVVSGIDLTRNTRLVVFSGAGKKPEIHQAEVVATDRLNDLALLEYDGKTLPAMAITQDKSYLREGSLIAFTGFPIGAILGFYPVTHTGVISSVTPIVIPADRARNLTARVVRRLKNPFMVYQLDATAYPGNSGSPVYNPENGLVVGVVNKVFVKETKESVLEKPSGITYAIPALALKKLLEKVKK